MNKTTTENYIIKMENNEYLVLDQVNDALDGFTTPDINMADQFHLDDVKEIIDSILNGTKVQDHFKVYITGKPISCLKVRTTTEILEESSIS